MSVRPVRKHSRSQLAIKGAGVHLKRAIGLVRLPEFNQAEIGN